MNYYDKAERLLKEFKGDRYVYGPGILEKVGAVARSAGSRAALIRDAFPGSDESIAKIKDSLTTAGVEIAAEVDGAGLLLRAAAGQRDQQRKGHGQEPHDSFALIIH